MFGAFAAIALDASSGGEGFRAWGRLKSGKGGATRRAFVASLMGRVAEPGKFANWIAPPARGIDNKPVEFDYVRFN